MLIEGAGYVLPFVLSMAAILIVVGTFGPQAGSGPA